MLEQIVVLVPQSASVTEINCDEKFGECCSPEGLIYDSDNYRIRYDMFNIQVLARMFRREVKCGVPQGNRTRCTRLDEHVKI
jgi:hypothetical protein